MATRRGVLGVLGGGVILAAAGAGGWAATRDPAAARAPWAAAGQPADPIRWALSYAILAPNPHNRQPWLVDLSVPMEVTLYCEASRRLEHTDPFDRQITVGLGAFLELLVMAAAEKALAAEVTLFPEGEPQPRLDARPVAHLRFAPDAGLRPDPLFAQVLARRTNRLPYDTARPVPSAVLQRIAGAAQGSGVGMENDPARVAVLRDLGWRAMQLEMTTPATMRESIDLTRIGRAEIEANPDGISLAGPLMEGLALAGMVSRAAMLDPASATFRQQMGFLKTGFDTAMAFVWLASPGNSRADQIRAGRDYVRLNLAATGEGVAMQPWSQALQEFPEMAGFYTEMRTALAIPAQRGLQMFARLGYADTPRPSPRWPGETRILAA